MVVLLILNYGFGKRHKPSVPDFFSTTMVCASLYGRDPPPPSVAPQGSSFRACKPVTPQHVCQWKDTFAAMECGDPIPWPTFVDFIRLRCTSASHCTCGTFQAMGVCEEMLIWLIPKDPQFKVLLLSSWQYLVS